MTKIQDRKKVQQELKNLIDFIDNLLEMEEFTDDEIEKLSKIDSSIKDFKLYVSRNTREITKDDNKEN